MERTTARSRRRSHRTMKRSRVLVVTRCLVAACCARLGDAFLSTIATTPTAHHSSRSGLVTRRQPDFCSRRVCVRVATPAVVMAAKGFGKSAPPPAAAGGKSADAVNGAGEGRGAAAGGGVESWEKEYKAYIKRTGQYLCSMSWEGHEEMGRGAIFANYDDAQAGGKLNEADEFGGIPSMYVPLTEFENMRAAGKPGEEDDLAQILQRVNAYSPEKEFVVVFQAAGIMGADIVRPNVSPPEMAKHVVQSDGMSTMPSASGLDGVIDVN